MKHSFARRRSFKKIGYVSFSVMFYILSNIIFFQPALAIDKEFYSLNEILFYDPTDTGFDSCDELGLKNQDYLGNTILSAAQVAAIESNKSFYESSATTANIPWQLLAAVHYRETRLKKEGPSNGYGPYQITPSGYRVGPYSDEEFQEATDAAAAFLRNKAGDRNLSDLDNIKFTLFAYNGAAGVYKTQARNLGFSDEEANNGEGSPYVMNRFDAQRDPTVEPTKTNGSWGQIKFDAGSIEYPANIDYGAFVVYELLSAACTSGGSLASGGMSLQEAVEFMDVYKNSSDSVNYIGTADRTCAGGPLSNCVSFSSYFLKKYTNINSEGSMGNGSRVVGNLILKNPGIANGTLPRPYAIFSVASGVTQCGNVKCGHTGVILGVDIERGKVIVGEANCSGPLSNDGAREYSLETFSSGAYTYVYSDGLLKEGL